MTNKEKQYVEKLEAYIEFLGEEIGFNAAYLSVHGIHCSDERYQKGIEFRSEISQFKSEVKEKQPMSAEDIFVKAILEYNSTVSQVYEFRLNKREMEVFVKAMHSFRDQGRDWDNIEKEFVEWDKENGFNSSQRDILNWFKQH